MGKLTGPLASGIQYVLRYFGPFGLSLSLSLSLFLFTLFESFPIAPQFHFQYRLSFLFCYVPCKKSDVLVIGCESEDYMAVSME